MWHPSSMLSNSRFLRLETQLWNTASQQQGWMLDSTLLGPLNIQLVLGWNHLFWTLHRDRGGPDVRLWAGRPLGSLFMIRGAPLLLGTIWLQESVWWVEPWHLPHLLGSVLGWGNRVWQTHASPHFSGPLQLEEGLWLVLTSELGGRCVGASETEARGASSRSQTFCPA